MKKYLIDENTFNMIVTLAFIEGKGFQSNNQDVAFDKYVASSHEENKRVAEEIKKLIEWCEVKD